MIDPLRSISFGVLALALSLSACATAAPSKPPVKAMAERTPLPFALNPYPSTYKPLPRTDVLIAHATVLDGAGHRLENADVLLRDGKVAAVGQGLSAPQGARVIEARGRWVTPGVIDMHSHDGDFAAPQPANYHVSDTNEATDPNAANVWAEHSVTVQDPTFSRALAGGVTTLQVLPGSSPLFGGRSVILKPIPATTVQAMKFPGAGYGLKMACGENPAHQFGDQGRFPSSRMGVVAGHREAWLKAQAYEHKWLDYEKGEGAEPPARDLKMDTLAGVLHGDIRVQMHCYRADDMAIALDMAKEFGFHISAFHHATDAYKIADLLRENGTCAAVWSDWWGYKVEAYDAMRENAAFVDAAGACVAMHSDTPVMGQRLTLEAGKAMAAGRRAGLPITPEHAIQWVTLNPAKAIGLDDRIGSLEVGKNADVTVWSGDPFSVYTKAEQVFIDGALAYDRNDPSRRPLADFELGQPSAGPRP
jgi:imidazolonepropionase-like amidohydrolase